MRESITSSYIFQVDVLFAHNYVVLLCFVAM